MVEERLSDLERKAIEKELRQAVNTLVAGCEALDMEQAFSVFWNAPGFLMMGTDGSLCDYAAYVGGNVEYLRTCSAFRLTTLREEVRILDRHTAVLAWAYSAEATLESGDRDIVENAGASFVFHKVNDEWRVVYYHESSVPPVRLSKGH